MSSTGSVWHVGSFKLSCEILLLLNIADMDSLMWKALECMSSAECHVHLVGMKRLGACREFFGVVGKMAQDVGMV